MQRHLTVFARINVVGEENNNVLENFDLIVFTLHFFMLRLGFYLLCQSNNNFPLKLKMDVKRAAGFLIFRRLDGKTEYLLLRASYGSKHWTPPKGFYSKIQLIRLSFHSKMYYRSR